MLPLVPSSDHKKTSFGEFKDKLALLIMQTLQIHVDTGSLSLC